jgi:transcriptional repressor BetI
MGARSEKAKSTEKVRRLEPEDVRRRQLILATIEAIAEVGFNAATVGEIARRAGVSVGLVAFYFQDKDGLLEATLRHLAGQLAATYVDLLRHAASPRARIEAMIEANLGAEQFDRRIATVWLAFWGQVPVRPRFARIQRVYERRMVANLTHDFAIVLARPEAARLAAATAAMIDGAWLRATLSAEPRHAGEARAMVSTFVDAQLALVGIALFRKDPRS